MNARPGDEGFNSFATARLQTHQARMLPAGPEAKTTGLSLSAGRIWGLQLRGMELEV